MSELARGIVLIEENLEPAGESELVENPETLRRGAYLAIEALAYDEASPSGEDADTVDQVFSGEFQEPQRRIKRPHQKTMRLDIKCNHSRIDRPISVRSFGDLNPTTKLLLAVGQVNAPQYSFFKSAEERQVFVLTLVNKGSEDEGRMSMEKVETMIGQMVGQGFVDQSDEAQWKLTETGMEHLLADEVLKRKLRNPAPIM